jgi:hypothetical protein
MKTFTQIGPAMNAANGAPIVKVQSGDEVLYIVADFVGTVVVGTVSLLAKNGDSYRTTLSVSLGADPKNEFVSESPDDFVAAHGPDPKTDRFGSDPMGDHCGRNK